MRPTNMVLCNNKLYDLFQVLKIEGLECVKNDDELGLLYRAFSQKTIEWALNNEYRDKLIAVLRRFSSFSNTSIGIFCTGSPKMHLVINFALIGKQAIYLLPMAELASDADTLFIPMNMSDLLTGEVIRKGTRINAHFETLPGPKGDIRACFVWADNKLMRNINA